jgi:hypothetical protein
MSRSWGHEVFVSVDQVINAVFGGFADETISARSFRLGNKAKARGAWDQWRVTWVIADALFVWQDWWIKYRTGLWPALGHCERAYHSEIDRLQLPPEYRQQ